MRTLVGVFFELIEEIPIYIPTTWEDIVVSGDRLSKRIIRISWFFLKCSIHHNSLELKVSYLSRSFMDLYKWGLFGKVLDQGMSLAYRTSGIRSDTTSVSPWLPIYIPIFW